MKTKHALAAYYQAIADHRRERQADNLAAWLLDPGAEKYFGKSFAIRLEVLAALLRNKRGELIAVARRRGISKQAVNCYAREARSAFGKAFI